MTTRDASALGLSTCHQEMRSRRERTSLQLAIYTYYGGKTKSEDCSLALITRSGRGLTSHFRMPSTFLVTITNVSRHCQYRISPTTENHSLQHSQDMLQIKTKCIYTFQSSFQGWVSRSFNNVPASLASSEFQSQ